jgi:hypothetical protein
MEWREILEDIYCYKYKRILPKLINDTISEDEKEQIIELYKTQLKQQKDYDQEYSTQLQLWKSSENKDTEKPKLKKVSKQYRLISLQLLASEAVVTIPYRSCSKKEVPEENQLYRILKNGSLPPVKSQAWYLKYIIKHTVNELMNQWETVLSAAVVESLWDYTNTKFSEDAKLVVNDAVEIKRVELLLKYKKILNCIDNVGQIISLPPFATKHAVGLPAYIDGHQDKIGFVDKFSSSPYRIIGSNSVFKHVFMVKYIDTSFWVFHSNIKKEFFIYTKERDPELCDFFQIVSRVTK